MTVEFMVDNINDCQGFSCNSFLINIMSIKRDIMVLTHPNINQEDEKYN